MGCDEVSPDKFFARKYIGLGRGGTTTPLMVSTTPPLTAKLDRPEPSRRLCMSPTRAVSNGKRKRVAVVTDGMEASHVLEYSIPQSRCTGRNQAELVLIWTSDTAVGFLLFRAIAATRDLRPVFSLTFTASKLFSLRF